MLPDAVQGGTSGALAAIIRSGILSTRRLHIAYRGRLANPRATRPAVLGQPSCAAFNSAMSILVMWSIASMTLLDLSGAGSLINAISTDGTICHETPNSVARNVHDLQVLEDANIEMHGAALA
jgi:hypothetical protein